MKINFRLTGRADVSSLSSIFKLNTTSTHKTSPEPTLAVNKRMPLTPERPPGQTPPKTTPAPAPVDVRPDTPSVFKRENDPPIVIKREYLVSPVPKTLVPGGTAPPITTPAKGCKLETKKRLPTNASRARKAVFVCVSEY
jgi:hypothetical protein